MECRFIGCRIIEHSLYYNYQYDYWHVFRCRSHLVMLSEPERLSRSSHQGVLITPLFAYTAQFE